MSDLLERARANARNCLNDWAKVQAGEHIFLLRDDGDYVEADVVDAFRDAAGDLGAVFSIGATRIFNARTEEPPEPIRRALEGADVILYFSPYPALIHSKAGRRAMLEYGARIVPILTPTVAMLASPWAAFPVELQLLLHRKGQEACHTSREVRVTSRQGTDISGLIPHTVSSVNRERLINGLGWHGIWPGECGPCLEPMEAMNGRIVVDVLPGFKGMLSEKMLIEVKENHIASIQGGHEAKWFTDFVGSSVAKGSDASLLFELQWGINPKGDIHRALETTHRDEVEISRIARTVHFGFGSGSRQFHWDVVMVDGFDIVVGTEAIYRDGRLTYLDDPEVRRVAAKYGDPDEILSEYTRLG